MHIGSGPLHRCRKIQNHLLLRRRLPHRHHALATLKCEVQFGIGKTLGRILQHDFSLGNRRHQFLHHLRSFHRNPLDVLTGGIVESHSTLKRAGGIIDVHDHTTGTFDRLKGPLNQMATRLHQHLHRDVVGNPTLLDQPPHKGELGVARRRKANFDLLEAHPHKQVKHLQFFFNTHRNGQRLVAIP